MHPIVCESNQTRRRKHWHFPQEKIDAVVDQWKQFRSESLSTDCNVELPDEESDEESIGLSSHPLTEFWSHVFTVEHLNGS